MNLHEAQTLAVDLMKEHNLLQSGWKFNWNNRKRALGVCNYTKKTIFLSSIATQGREESGVRNTILHEIAHALVGSGHNHNHVWRSKAIEIGCDGKRGSDDEVNVQAKYTAECDCGITHNAHRRPKRKHWCRCKGRAFNPLEVLKYVQNF